MRRNPAMGNGVAKRLNFKLAVASVRTAVDRSPDITYYLASPRHCCVTASCIASSSMKSFDHTAWHLRLRSTLLLWSLALVASSGFAQSGPPLKPGLWEMRSNREVDGRAMTSQRDHVESLKPEARARVEDMLRHSGTSADDESLTVARMCLTGAKLADGRWHGVDSTCAANYSARDDKAWKWHASCRQAETDGAVVFAGPEQFMFRTETTYTADGVARVMKTNANFRWLGEDCGRLR